MGIRWGVVGVLVVALCFQGWVCADEIEDMKRAMEEMKREMAKAMEKMEADVQAEREAMRQEREAMQKEREAMRQERETLQAERDSVLAAAGGEPEALLSQNKQGKIKIGGLIAAGYQFSRQSRTDNPHIMDHTAGNWYWKDLALTFDIQMSEKVSGRINLDLDDNNYDTADTSGLDRLIEEAYITWKDIGGIGLDAQVGKQVLPFGFYYTGAVASDAYTKHAGSTWQGNSRGVAFGEYDNRTALKLSYAMKKFWDALFEAAVFQNASGDTETRGVGFVASQNTNMTNWGEPTPSFAANPIGDGRQDDYGFQSFATRLTVHPIESLMLQASFMSQHNEAAGRYEYTTVPACDSDNDGIPDTVIPDTEGGGEWIQNLNGAKDVYAMSLAAKYDFKAPFSIFGEYVATWNLGNIRGLQSDIVTVGIDWRPKQFNDQLTITLLGDYQYISGIDDSADGIDTAGGVAISELGASRGNTVNWVSIEEEHLTRVILGGKYTMKNGLFLGAEVGHEWWYRYGNYQHNPNFDNVNGVSNETISTRKDQQLDATRFSVYMGMEF